MQLLRYIKFRSYSSKVNKNKYSNTVLLPQTSFPLRLEHQKLIERDSKLNELNKSIYAWQRDNLPGPDFVLHDGPPYANGVPHMGHAINKILKDIIVRSKILSGQRAHYVHGWDCHGLPIELKAVTNTKGDLTPIQIRHRARNFAQQTIEKQKKAFISWGVIGDYENAYKTFNKDYIQNQLQQFYTLYEKNLIYRDFKPVYWSPSSGTALAESELEYKADHRSTAATVAFETVKLPNQLSHHKNVSILIWTTTPWTLPSNQTVCFNKEISYSLIQDKSGSSNKFIISTNLVRAHSKLVNKEFTILDTFSGDLLENVTYKQPIYDNELPLVESNHATDSKGTGLVHCAPAHGPEDFLVALKYNINIKNLVDETGSYTSEAGQTLEGLPVLTGGSEKVLNIIKDKVVHIEDFVHSYPYDWRTKQPVILRACKQWFIDTNAIKDRAIELLKDVQVIPKMNGEMYKTTLTKQLKKRPYWCISRQRIWGTPIPVFYEKSSGKPIVNKKIIDHLVNMIESNQGVDFWWQLPIEELLPQNILDELKLSIDEIEKGQDILDIWFDSGVSWSKVLEGEKVADIYLEGLDQFNGWFQSSLMTSVAIRDKAPYKSLYVHGFALDENGLKMSKSLGNVIDPQEILQGGNKQKPYGVDTLRWWVACHANQDCMAYISKNVLQASAEEVQKVRSTLRFAVGALTDYSEDILDNSKLHLIDRYMLHTLCNFKRQADDYLKEYQFNKLCTSVINLTTNQISALYYTAIKDRLYCDTVDSDNRRSAQFVLNQMFLVLGESLGSIVPHLIEELHGHLHNESSKSFYESHEPNKLDEWHNDSVEEVMKTVLDVKKELNKILGANTNNSSINIKVSKEFSNKIEDISRFSDELVAILQVSSVSIEVDEQQNILFNLETKQTDKFNCQRCRKFTSITEGDLCNRCSDVLQLLEKSDALKI